MDVRRLKMLQMVQLFKCEEDALQVGQTGRTHPQRWTSCTYEVVRVFVSRQ